MRKIFFLIIIIHCLHSCEKSDPVLVQEETYGVMSAKVAGKSWLAKYIDGAGPTAIITSLGGVDFTGLDKGIGGVITLETIDKADIVAGKTIEIKSVNNPGDIENTAAYIVEDVSGLTKEYYAVSGTLKITSASSNNVKGTFNFDAVNSVNGSDKISITEGKFDLPLK
jgi:hypothetical protein